jgi:hypothetical protein
MFKFIRFFSFFILFISNVYPQDSTNYFPHGDGDLFQYLEIDNIVWETDTLQIINYIDSITLDQSVFFHHEIEYIYRPELGTDTLKYKIDSLNNIYDTTYPENIRLLYKLNADKNETWLVDSGVQAQIVDVYADTVFGIPTTTKIIRYFAGTWLYEDYLSDGFGLIARFGYELGYDLYLNGAIVDDKMYGNIINPVTIEKNKFHLNPSSFHLFQNYPNPFNSQTTIPINLIGAAIINLKIVDLNGRIINNLIAGKKFLPGMYKIPWDGKSHKGVKVSSGTYFYILEADGYKSIRKMQLLK